MKRGLWIVGILAAFAAPAGALTWAWECDTDPRALDSNGDGVMDWIERNGNPFDTGNLTPGGTWRAINKFGEIMDNRPRNPYNTPTTVDLRWRSYTEDPWAAVFWINADYFPSVNPPTPGYTFAPIWAILERLQDQTQRLTLMGKTDPATNQILAEYLGLPDDFIDLHMEFDPVADTVSVSIDGGPVDVYNYTAFEPQNNDDFCTVLGADAEFDYVRIEVEDPPQQRDVPEPATLLLMGLGTIGVGLRLRRRRRG